MAVVEISADTDDVLYQIDIGTAIDYYGSGNLLDEIGDEEAKSYFGLEEIKEEQ